VDARAEEVRDGIIIGEITLARGTACVSCDALAPHANLIALPRLRINEVTAIVADDTAGTTGVTLVTTRCL
jgi:hypothetical protein